MAALGLVILVAAVIVGTLTALANSGSDHLVTNFSILSNEISGSTGRLFLYGAAVGAAGMLGLNMFLAGLGRGLKNKVKTRRQIKAERNKTEELSTENEELERKLKAQRAANQDQEAIDLTEGSEEPVGRHHRI